MKRRDAPVCAALAAAPLLWPTPAAAHLVGIAFGPFYAGALHVMVSAGTMAVLVALAAITGTQARRSGRWVIVAAPPAVAVGALIGSALPGQPITMTLELLVAAGLGALAALAPRLGPLVLAGLAALGGVALGMANGFANAGTDTWLTVFGIVGSATLLLALGTAGLRRLADVWSPALIGSRVLGGWAAAIGAIALGGRAAGIA